MEKKLRILILEDVAADAELLERELRNTDIRFNSRQVATREAFLKQLEDFKPDIILSDYMMPQFTGMDALEIVKEKYPTIPVIIVTGSMNEETAVECMKKGATDYVIKEHILRIGPAINAALEKKRTIDEKIRVDKALINAGYEWKTTFDAINDAVCLLDFDGKILRGNVALRNILGKPFKEIIGHRNREFFNNLVKPNEVCPFERMKETRIRESLAVQLNNRWFTITVDPLMDDDNNIIGGVQIISDITERKQSEKRIKHLNSLLRAIRTVNQLIAKEKDRDRLLKGTCKSFSEIDGFNHAWIALINESGKLVFIAETGLGKKFQPIDKLLKSGKLPVCAKRALAQPEVVIIKDDSICKDCFVAGYNGNIGTMSIRLEHQGKVYGLLTVSLPIDAVNNEDEQNLLNEVAGDIAFGLHSMELEEKRKLAEEALKKRTFDLGERVKELDCLYSISKLIESEDISLNEIFQGVVDLIPPSWQYPEITCARIIIDKQEYSSDNFRKTKWKQTSNIVVGDKKIGNLDVCYLEEKPEIDEGPFLKEERYLINAIAERLGKSCEHRKAEEALRENESKYRTLVENIPQKIFLKDNNSVYLSCNENYARDLKIKPEDITGKTDNDFYPKELAEKYRTDDKRIMKSKKTEELEERYIQNGQEYLVHTIKTPVTDDKGNVIGIFGIFWDITESRRAQDALKASEASLSEAQHIAHLGNWDLNIKTNELHWSDEIYHIFGLNAQEFDPTHDAFLNSVHPDDQEFVIKSVNETLNEKKPYSIDHRIVLPDSSERIVHEQAEVLYDESGKPIRMVGTVQDITERVQSEKKIEEYSKNLEGMVEERTRELNRALYDTEAARDRIDGILKSVADGLIVTDKYNRVVLMNRAAENLLGVRFSEVIDRTIEYAIEEKTLREKLVNTFNNKKTNYQFDFQLPGDDPKHPQIMRARTSIIFGKGEEKTGIVTIISDVTHEREVDRMKTEFISTAAHELRTPLTSIVGFSKILMTREDISEEERKRFLSYINKQGVNLANIVNDLLDISRIESGRGFELNKEICDVRKVIEEVIPYFQEIFLEHEFEVVLPDEPVELFVDREKFEQLVKNILGNAVKYSPESGMIRVSGEIIENDFHVSVEDNGIGMTPEQVEKIFDKFYRVDTSDSAPEGTGLGMVIVKHIIEAHGGKVWVESEFGKGTTVRFSIPIRNKKNKK